MLGVDPDLSSPPAEPVCLEGALPRHPWAQPTAGDTATQPPPNPPSTHPGAAQGPGAPPHQLRHATTVPPQSAEGPVFPTTGAFAIWLALTQCSRVTLFGFGWCDGKAPDYGATAVYYDPLDSRQKRGFDIWHAPEREMRWVGRMTSEGVLNRSCS